MSQFQRNMWCETLTLGPSGSELILSVDKVTGEILINTPFASQPSRKIPYRMATDLDNVANVGGGEDPLMLKSIGADAIGLEGQYLTFFATFHIANSAGTKTTKVYINTTEVASIVSAANAALSQIAEGEITRIDATTLHFHVRLFDADGTSGALGTQWAEFHNDITVVAGAAFTLSFTGTGTANNDIIQDALTINVVP